MRIAKKRRMRLDLKTMPLLQMLSALLVDPPGIGAPTDVS